MIAVAVPGGQLDEVDAIDVAVEARGFRVHGHERLRPGGGDHFVERGGGVDVAVAAHSSPLPSCSRPPAISSSALARVL